jgi:hypothetical protein
VGTVLAHTQRAWRHGVFWFGFSGPGRLVNKFAILVIDFVTALFYLGVKKTAWWMIKYPRIKKNAQQFFDPVSPILGS